MTDREFRDEVRSRLYQRRVVSIFGRLDEERVSDIAAEMWSLDATGDEPVSLLFSCSGGSVASALALIDVIEVVGVEVHATCVGALQGPPVAAFAAAHRRRAAPNARFEIHEEPVRLAGTYRQLAAAASSHEAQRQLLASSVAASTHGRRSLGDVLVDLERGLVMSSSEAVAYGIVDEIVEPPRAVTSIGRKAPGLGFRPERPR